MHGTAESQNQQQQPRLWLPADTPIRIGKALGGNAYLIYSLLAMRAGRNDACWPSIERLSKESGLSERHVRRLVAELEHAGEISVERRRGAGNRYRIRRREATKSKDTHVLTSDSDQGHPCPQVRTPMSLGKDTHVLPLRTPMSSESSKRIKYKNQVKESGAKDHDLAEWIERWNRWKADGLVHTGTTPKPSSGVLAGWKRVQSSDELQEILTDPQAVEDQLRRSPFCCASWFRLEKLFGGKNQDGEYVARVLMAGGYESNSKGGRNGHRTNGHKHGPGQLYDPAYTGGGDI